MEFINETTGEKLDEAQVREAVERAIDELTVQLDKAWLFRLKLGTGDLRCNDEFLDFTAVIENGYDRTGPNIIKAVE
jgi:hypothetical protein